MVTGIFDNLKSSRVSPLWYSVPLASLASVVVYRQGSCPIRVALPRFLHGLNGAHLALHRT